MDSEVDPSLEQAEQQHSRRLLRKGARESGRRSRAPCNVAPTISPHMQRSPSLCRPARHKHTTAHYLQAKAEARTTVISPAMKASSARAAVASTTARAETPCIRALASDCLTRRPPPQIKPNGASL